MCLVSIAGNPLPADLVPLLESAVVDDSQRYPDLFVLRFRDPAHLVLSKSGAKIGAPVTVSVQTDGAPAPTPLIEGEVTALESEFDAGGTFTVVRGYDQAHRLFRGRRTASYVQMTASDVAVQVARRAGLSVATVASTTTVYDHLGQAGETDWDFLARLARASGREVLVRAGSFSFTAPKAAADAPAAGGTEPRPLVLQLGKDLLRLRSVLSSAQQAGTVEVRGWDVATKKALTATAPARTTSADLPTVTPAALAAAFGEAVHVATEVPFRSQAEVDEAARTLADSLAGTFAELEGVARGNPQVRAGAAISVDGLGEPFDGKYTVTTSRHRFDPSTGYTTQLTVSGRQDRSLLGLASAGSRAPAGQPGVVVAQVSDVADPQRSGRVRLTFPWLADDYVSDWARTVQAGAGKDRGAAVLPEVGDEVLVAFEQGDFSRPTVLGGLYNGVDTLPAGQGDLVDGGTGAVRRRSVVSRRGHRVDLLDADGQSVGVRVATTGDKLLINLDHVGTTITVHADGKVSIEGSQGVTIDSSSAAMELKGGSISIKATSGVTVDGGGGAVSLTGTTAKLEGSGTTEVKGGAMVSVSGAMVKIN